MALHNARRPYACEVDFMSKQTANECALPAKGVEWEDDEARVCGRRCIAAAIRAGDMTDAELGLAQLIAEQEFGDTPTDKSVTVMLRNGGVELDG